MVNGCVPPTDVLAAFPLVTSMILINGLVLGTVTIDQVFSNPDFLSIISQMLDTSAFVPYQVVLPVEGLHVLVSKFWFKLVLSTTAHKHAFWHILTDGPEVESISIIAHNILARLAHDDSNVKETSNVGLFNRALLTAEGKVVDMEGPFHLDLFTQSRYMLSGVEIGLKLWASQNAFQLQTDVVDPNYKVQIVDAWLKVCLQKLNPAILVAHENLFKKESAAFYPYLRSEIKSASIASGQFSFSADDMIQGLVISS